MRSVTADNAAAVDHASSESPAAPSVARTLRSALSVMSKPICSLRFARRSVVVDFHAVFLRVHRAGNACQLLAPRVLANVRGTEVKALTGRVNLDGVEIFTTQDFDARDHSAACGKGFLHQGGGIDAKVEAIGFDGGAQLIGRTETLDSRAAPADIRLEHHRIADGFGGRKRLRRMIDDAGLRIRQTEFFEVAELERFGSLVSEATVAVHYPHTLGFKVRKIIQGVEDSVSQAALPCRRAHAIEQQRILALRRGGVVVMMARLDL